MSDVVELLRSIRSQGAVLHVNGGKLRYRAPFGVIGDRELSELRRNKEEVISLVCAANEVGRRTPLVPRGQNDLARLPPAHEWAWVAYRETGELISSMRTVAVARRISGALIEECLTRSLKELVCAHEALRTRIVESGGIPTQVIDGPESFEVDRWDLSDDVNPERAAKLLVEEFIGDKVRLAEGPLFGVRLIRLAPREYVVVLALEHSIADGVALRILLHHLGAAYRALAQGFPSPIEPPIIQFADYCHWAHSILSWWMITHYPYWSKYLADAPCVRFPKDKTRQPNEKARWTTVSFGLGDSLSAALRYLSGKLEVTLAMIALSVYVATILRWQSKTEMVVAVVDSGRNATELAQTIGNFASVLKLRVTLPLQVSWSRFVKSVSNEYAAAHDHYEYGFLCIAEPQGEFHRVTHFNWTRERSGGGSPIWLTELLGAEVATLTPFHFDRPTFESDVDFDPQIWLWDREGGIDAMLWYRADLLSQESLNEFVRIFLAFAARIAAAPNDPVPSALDI